MTKKVDLPALNWFVHALADNIGGVEWVRKTAEELAKSESDYPYNVVTHPIPEGKDIYLESGKYKIECSEQYVKDLILELARHYQQLEREHGRLKGEKRSEVWHTASEVPDGPHSACKKRLVLVTSPVLHWVVGNGVCQGYEYEGWYILIDGKAIPHAVSHWRHLPPGMGDTPPYEMVASEVELLKNAIKASKPEG